LSILSISPKKHSVHLHFIKKSLSHVSVLLILLAISPAMTLGQSEVHTHEELARSDELTFDILVSAAMEQSSEMLSLASIKNQAEAYADASDGILPGQYTWRALVFDDGATDKRGIRETEMGIDIGLWRRGEKSAAKLLSASYGNRVDVFDRYLRWLSSGRVRQALAELGDADNAFAGEQEITENLNAIVDVVSALLSEGAVAEADLLRVQAEVLDQEIRVLDAQAALVDAERNYQLITGLALRPSTNLVEPVPYLGREDSHLDVARDHPLLQMLNQKVEISKGGAERIRFNARNRTTVSVGVRREEAGAMVPNTDTVSIGISVPLGGKRQSRPQVEDALSVAADAELSLHQARRSLQSSLHEAAHQLSVITEALSLNSRRKTLAERRVAMTLAAFEEGEVNLEEVLRVRRALSSIDREINSLEAEKIRRVGEYRQAQGDTL
jgi:cobalt-zinc-cadmium efflux system outer membrane protein